MRLLVPLCALLLSACTSALPPASAGGSPAPPVVPWDHDWARGAVFYEVFVRSFQDSNGDGIGDLPGLISRLDALNDGNPVDLVMNHTSAQHPWFVEASAAPRSPYRDWYVWRADDPGWTQPWGGTNRTWHEKNGAFFYGIFWGGMPDLDFSTPAVRVEVAAAGGWERGVAAGVTRKPTSGRFKGSGYHRLAVMSPVTTNSRSTPWKVRGR